MVHDAVPYHFITEDRPHLKRLHLVKEGTDGSMKLPRHIDSDELAIRLSR